MIDLYCERLGPGLWAEPVNAATNVAYIVGAWALWRFAAQRRASTAAASLLPGLMVTIGLGSALFHTVGTPWARLADELPILAFQPSFLWMYARGIIRMAPWSAAGLAVGFLSAVVLGRQLPDVLNGSLFYAPALVFIIGLGLYHQATGRQEPWLLLAATGIFVAAILLRTVDIAVCAAFPVGTHFLWHVLTAAVLYLFGRGLLENLEGSSSVQDAATAECGESTAIATDPSATRARTRE